MHKPSFGVIVGRFQVHELHDGHMELFRIVRGKHNRVIVFLGCTKVGPTRTNPLDFETRRKMIQAKFPDFTVLPLQDKKTDETWSRELDQRIEDAVGGVPADIVLYGSRDSFAPFYHGRHKVQELEINVSPSLSGTDIRGVLTNTVMEDPNFRAGIIYAMNQLFPRVITCVDIVILHRAQDGVMALLGKKTEDARWRFVGGHASNDSESFEKDAVREAYEETGLDVGPPFALKYIGSLKVEDWRWRSEKTEGIKTLVFVGWSPTMGGAANDDLDQMRWFKLDSVAKGNIESEHQPIFDMLVAHYSAFPEELR